MMFKIEFLSHVAKLCDKKSIDIPIHVKTIGDALDFLYSKCPELKPYLNEKPQEFVLLMDSMNINPDLNSSRTITDNLFVSPIIGGGT